MRRELRRDAEPGEAWQVFLGHQLAMRQGVAPVPRRVGLDGRLDGVEADPGAAVADGVDMDVDAVAVGAVDDVP